MKKLIILTLSIVCFAGFALAKSKEKEVVFEDDFANDIFLEMQEMEKEMQKSFLRHQKLMEKMWQSSQKQGFSSKSSKNSLSVKQDEKKYIYELKFEDFKKEDVVVAINDGVLTISAKNFITDKNGEKQVTNNLFYSLSLPKDAKNEPKITRENKRLVVEFERVK